AQRLVEHLSRQRFEDAVAEREIDEEIDATAAAVERREMPFIVEMAHRSVDIMDRDMGRPMLFDPARKTLAQPLEADDHVGERRVLVLTAYAQGDDPWQKFGVTRDIGDEREHLFGAVGQFAGFVVPGQGQSAAARASCASRAARMRSKSSPA